MASVTTATVNSLYLLKAKLRSAVLALEEYVRVANPSAAPDADTKLATAVASSTVLAGAGVSTQAILSSGVKSTATVSGSGTTGVTPTIVAGVVTGYVLS